MNAAATAHLLSGHAVIPLASIRAVEHVDVIGDGLAHGGLPVVEVALRGPHGVEAIRRLVARGDLLVGAGTVLTVRQACDVLAAGAQFIVTPGLDPDVVRFAQDSGVPIIPGVVTPTEVQAAMRLGLRRVKFFPAGSVNGFAWLSAYTEVFPDVQFMPSGGVTPTNLADYLGLPSVFAVSGSWITAAADRGSAAVADACRQAVASAASRPAL